ncbi:MAG TPA: DUF1416 domain-containing protein [Actinomycetota bacterium]
MPSISGTVTKGDSPVGGAYVRCVGPSGEFVAEIYTKDDGAFTFHVADGTWKLETRADGFDPTVNEVAIAGSDATVSVEL